MVATRRKHSTTRRELVSDRILEEAAELFATRGFSETSLQDVASALGISRTALYHYVGGKDQLLATLVHGLAGETADRLDGIVADGALLPLEKLREATRTVALRIAENTARFRMLLATEGALGEPLASEHHAARVRILDAMRHIIDEGIATGAVRPIDLNVAAFALLGMCNWVAWWYQPEREEGQPPERLAEMLAEFAIAGLRAQPTGEAALDDSADPVDRALELVRRDLTQLEITLAARTRNDATQTPSPRTKRRGTR
jgi:AcrR family transcriptional regulator